MSERAMQGQEPLHETVSEPVRDQVRVRHRSGAVLCVEVSVAPIRNDVPATPDQGHSPAGPAFLKRTRYTLPELIGQRTSDLLHGRHTDPATVQPISVALWAQHQVRASLGEIAQGKGLGLSVALALDLPLWLLGDALRLEQVPVTLVGIAIKFTSKGTVEVKIGVQDRSPQTCSLRV